MRQRRRPGSARPTAPSAGAGLVLCFLFTALAPGGCVKAASAEFTLRFAPASLESRAERVSIRILDGGCNSDRVYARYDVGEEANESVLPPGTWGLEATASEGCVAIARGCTDVVLPEGSERRLEVVLGPLEEPESSCPDAGPDLDAGPNEHDLLFDELSGYGRGTTGGAAGAIYWVTSLDDSGPGTLRAAVESADPLWVRFAVAGTITLQSALDVGSDKTVDGRDERVEIAVAGDFEAMRLVGTSNIILHNLVFVGGAAGANAIWVYDADLLWLHHNSMTGWGENLLAMPLVGRATVSWNDFYDQPGGHGIQIGVPATADQQGNTRVTLHHNRFSNVADRSPRVQNGGWCHAYNNLVEGWTWYGMAGVAGAHLLAEANVFAMEADDTAIKATESSLGPGVVKATGNLLGDAVVEEQAPGSVFDPSLEYAYEAEAATTTLRDRLIAETGWRAFP